MLWQKSIGKITLSYKKGTGLFQTFFLLKYGFETLGLIFALFQIKLNSFNCCEQKAFITIKFNVRMLQLKVLGLKIK